MIKTRFGRKSNFRYKLQLMSPLKPKKILPTDTKVCVVDASRVLRLIPITTIQPPTLMKSAEAVKTYLENLKENTLHVVLDDYSPRHGNILKKIAQKV